MKILTFTMNYADERWPAYLTNTFGKDVADKCLVESHQMATSHNAKISILNFDGNTELIAKIQNHEGVTSAYIAQGKTVTNLK